MAEPTPTVYSYYSPEVASVCTHYFRTHTGNVHDAHHQTLRMNIEPGLDELHLPLMRKYEQFARGEGVIGLETFKHSYYTNGSSEGLFHLIARYLTLDLPLYVLEGEYQGYGEFAKALGKFVQPISLLTPVSELQEWKSGVIFLVNPASHDGNVRTGVLNDILRNTDHRVVLDLAYMGMTQKPLNIDLTHPKIVAVVGSLSKPFGLYYHRIGFCYSVSPIDSLFGNKWFKNALSIKLGEAVLDEIDLESYKRKYFALQERARGEADTALDWPLLSSDVWLLAHGSIGVKGHDKIDPFKRGNAGVRACLTPYYQEWENE